MKALMEKSKKRGRVLAGLLIVTALMLVPDTAEAAGRHDRHRAYGHTHGHHGRIELRYYRDVPAYRSYFRGPRWHDTSHYDWHDTSHYDWHGDHYDYHPSGHYDYHRSGHWD